MVGMKAIVRVRKAHKKPYMTPDDVAKLLGVNPQMVRVSLKQRAAGWDFPFTMCGRNIRIPRDGFMTWYRNRGKTNG